jgi:hypothetical protein
VTAGRAAGEETEPAKLLRRSGPDLQLLGSMGRIRILTCDLWVMSQGVSVHHGAAVIGIRHHGALLSAEVA